jgi:type II restriction/modification system DNA methylase subunit YeeA
MNTKNLKAYAPKARAQFIEAIKKRAAQLGIYEDRIVEVQIEGSAAIIEGRVFTSRQGQQQKRLAKRVNEKGYDLFVREMSYTWFNRLAAIRYMELHDYLDHGFRVLSHPNSPDRLPEILDHASDVVDNLDPDKQYLDKNHIIELQLAGDKEEELYRELLLGQCHRLHHIMPFMFEAINDATELLLPDNLTKTDSILKGLVNEIPEEDWQEIEVIGWLYQFYISEHKNAVIGNVVKSEDIPAATQLFTPNWIVKYLVQNSLGRQWLATYPESDIKGSMEYYIEPAEQSEDVIEQLKKITPTSIDPEQIKVLDPAAGSGHILVEVYEVLREIYLERGYRLREIPELILTKNIYGLDIDDRAAQLAGFALMMKAREDDRRIFDRVERGDVQLNVYAMQSSKQLNINQLWSNLNLENKHHSGDIEDMFAEIDDTKDVDMSSLNAEHFAVLRLLQSAFINAKNLGSLIDVQRELSSMLIALNLRQLKLKGELTSKHKLMNKLLDLKDSKLMSEAYELSVELKLLPSKIQKVNEDITLFRALENNLIGKLTNFQDALIDILSKSDSDYLAISASHELIPFVEQAIMLETKYDVCIANPPYMGSKGMNADLKEFAKKFYPNSKSDLFAVFMERAFSLLSDTGYNAQVNMQSWMFLSSFEAFREYLLDNKTISSLVQIGYNSFPELNSKVVQCTAFCIRNSKTDEKGLYINLNSASQSANKKELFLQRDISNKHDRQQNKFKNIPGYPIAYWFPEKVYEIFNSCKNIGDIAAVRTGMTTADNELFLRSWFEVSHHNILFDNANREDARESLKKWFPYNKGGGFRKWYGMNESIINWLDDGKEIKNNIDNKGKAKASVRSASYYFLPCITYSSVTSSEFSSRLCEKGFLFDSGGSAIFSQEYLNLIQAVLSTSVPSYFLKAFNSTLNFQPGDVSRIPIPDLSTNELITIENLVQECVEISKKDWDSKETSWGFRGLDFLSHKFEKKIEDSINMQVEKNELNRLQLLTKEKQIESIVLKSLGLENIIFKKERSKTSTLFSDLNYKFGFGKSEEELNKLNKCSNVEEIIHFVLGCMMGRYSLDREGFVYAHSGNEGFKELVAEGAYQTFPADDDGIVPLASEDWLFDDDATARFREFFKTVWGEEHLQENLEFVAESLCLHAIKPIKNNKGQGESAMDTVRRYFSTQFFKYHCKTYKNRPIYWLFSSGKEKPLNVWCICTVITKARSHDCAPSMSRH